MEQPTPEIKQLDLLAIETISELTRRIEEIEQDMLHLTDRVQDISNAVINLMKKRTDG